MFLFYVQANWEFFVSFLFCIVPQCLLRGSGTRDWAPSGIKPSGTVLDGTDIDYFINRLLIYNYPDSLLSEKGIMVIERANFEGFERLSLGMTLRSTRVD